MSIYDDRCVSKCLSDSSEERDTVIPDDRGEPMQCDPASLLDPSDASSRLYGTVTPKAQDKAGSDEQGQHEANGGMALLNSGVMESSPEDMTVVKAGESTRDVGEAGQKTVSKETGGFRALAYRARYEPLPARSHAVRK